jgi:hypothetical protein
LIHSTFVRVRCPTATTLIEMKQLCGVANDLLAHRVTSRQCTTSVAFGAKRRLSRIYEYTA